MRKHVALRQSPYLIALGPRCRAEGKNQGPRPQTPEKITGLLFNSLRIVSCGAGVQRKQHAGLPNREVRVRIPGAAPLYFWHVAQ